MTSRPSATRRYLAVFLPWLPAERAVRAGVAPPDTAFALTGRVAGGMRILAVSVSADAALVGLTLADARARVPALTVVAHDAAADRALLEWIADGCERFSPTVALDPPDGVVIDITGCNEFGDETALAAAVHDRLHRCGVTPAVAVGPTPDAAVALARFGVATVGDLPLAALRIDDRVRLALGRTGLITIGALAQRPRAPLAARFGVMVPRQLARLLGEEDVRLVPRRAPSVIIAERRFAEPVTAAATVRATLDRLMTAAGEQLAARGLGGRRFEAALFRSDGHVARLGIATAGPTRDPAVVARLLAERIETLADPLDPGFGYDLIRFTVPVTQGLGPTQLRFDEAGPAAGTGLLIDRLTTRLGSERVRRLASGDSHIPERAAFDLPTAAGAASWPAPVPDEAPRRPLHLFAPPQPIEVVAEVPDGPPRAFSWQRLRHRVMHAEGPERIAAEWWHRRDARGATRDYYRVEDGAGRRFWVFRHGLYGVEKASPRWYLHGVFA